MVIIYLRPITLRPILLDSLPFSTFSKATYSLLSMLFPNLVGFRQDCKKNCKFFQLTSLPVIQFDSFRERNKKDVQLSSGGEYIRK